MLANLMDELCWLNGSFMPISDARVSVDDRGFNFADGVYEVFRVYRGHVLRLESHLARLRRSCEGIELVLPISDDAIGDIVFELIRLTSSESAMIYMQVTRGVSPRSHLCPADVAPTVLISIRPLPKPGNPGEIRGQQLITVTDERWQRCWIKSIALLPNILAKRAAERAGADEALFLDGIHVQEGSTSNVFVVNGNTIQTPPIGPKVLPGITREIVLELAPQLGFEAIESPVRLADLLYADEVFITSTTRELAWVESIDGKTISNRCGGATLKLHRAFQQLTSTITSANRL